MSLSAEKIRNVAIIAHVDHGKTTLVDQLLRQSGTLSERGEMRERVMDSNALEQERGITILAKNTAIDWQNYRINIVDTPGHADFGGEVERILSMVDSVLLLVDALDGPMPQTRFVTQKAFARGLNPIVVINKMDRDGARPTWVENEIFELFSSLGASEEQLDFRVIYASALTGRASTTTTLGEDLVPLFETIVAHVPPPAVEPDAPLCMQISALDYSSYVGAIGVGRILAGTLKANQQVLVTDREGESRRAKVLQILGYKGLDRVPQDSAVAGDIVAVTGIEPIGISDTLCDPEHPRQLEALSVDEPTVCMQFQVNDSPFVGRDGDYVTSRQLRERLEQELIHNVALRVEWLPSPDKFRVLGRGELHLAILIENMRREGYELAVSRPEVLLQTDEDGNQQEPYEWLVVDFSTDAQGAVMEALGERKGLLQNMSFAEHEARVRLEYLIPARGLIGFHTDFLTLTGGTGLMSHVFEHYGPLVEDLQAGRHQGVLIANGAGEASAYALWKIQERGRMLIEPNTEVYEGMIIGRHTRENDLVVNVTREKQLTNIRAAGKDENMILTPPIRLSLEAAIEFIQEDELVEVTPKHIRLRKKFLKEHERKKQR